MEDPRIIRALAFIEAVMNTPTHRADFYEALERVEAILLGEDDD